MKIEAPARTGTRDRPRVSRARQEVFPVQPVKTTRRRQRKELPRSIVIKAQVGKTYLVGEYENGMIIIDQHALHEKINYEILKERYSSRDVPTQELLKPVNISLTAEEESMLEERRDIIADLGFEVVKFGPRVYVVKKVPVVMGKAVSADALHDLLAPGTPTTPGEAEDHCLKTMACHHSIRAGKTLSQHEMEELITLMYRARDPFTCPHGRPTMVLIPFKELEKRFERT